MRLYLIIIGLFFVAQQLSAQQLAALGTRFDDSFAEWLIYGAEEEVQGEITLRWPLQNDWSEWDFRIGELSGSIRMKWKGDANLWELRANNEVITIRTIWKDDWRQWQVQSGTHRFDMKSKYGNILEEWSTSGERFGTLDIYTSWEGDLRDWVIEDQLYEEVSLPTKVALVFIPILYATPKF